MKNLKKSHGYLLIPLTQQLRRFILFMINIIKAGFLIGFQPFYIVILTVEPKSA